MHKHHPNVIEAPICLLLALRIRRHKVRHPEALVLERLLDPLAEQFLGLVA